MAHCRDVMRTSNPSHDYAFSWTIEHFGELSPRKVRGPAFSPIPGYLDKFSFELEYRSQTYRPYNTYLDFKIIDLDNNIREHRINVSGKATIKNTRGEVSDLMTFPFQNIEPITTLYSFTNKSFPRWQWQTINLDIFSADRQIIFGGTLTFLCYGVKSSIYSIPDRNCEELSKNLKTMFESGLASDVTFTVGGQTLRAHKAILVARSEVFAKMFQHDMLENETNHVTIEDVDYGTLNRFLVYLYTGILDPVEDDCSTAMESLYSVAQKYQVKGLCQICVSRLATVLSVESVCADLVLADLHGDEVFKGILILFLRENFFSVVGTDSWAEIVVTKPALAREVMDFVKPAVNNTSK